MNERVAVYCINCPNDVGRKNKVLAAADREGFQIEIVEAVLGKDLRMEDAISQGYNSARRNRIYPDLEIKEIACMLSHKKCLQIFQESNKDFCLILEDDADFGGDLGEVVDEFIEHWEGWEAVKLECRSGNARGPDLGTVCSRFEAYATLEVAKGATGFCYSRSGAEKVLGSMDDFIGAIDTHLGGLWRIGLQVVGVCPGVVWEREGEPSVVFGGRNSRAKRNLAAKAKHRLRRFADSFGKRRISAKTSREVHRKNAKL